MNSSHLHPSKILAAVALKVMNMNDIPGTLLAKQVECVVLKGISHHHGSNPQFSEVA